MGRAVGIDLGTTNSCLATIDNGRIRVIPNAEGEAITPSVVALQESGEILVGSSAKRQAVLNPGRTVCSSKRFIGLNFDDSKIIRNRFSYAVERRDNGQCQFNLGEKLFNPEDIAALILQKLVRDASKNLGEEITDAVITVPAYFNDSQRHATKLAGEIAGLNVLRIINEPTAAALAQGLGVSGRERVVVYDIGGGTTDVTVLEIDKQLFEVQSTSGDTFLGGDDFDALIVDWIVSRCKKLGAEGIEKDRVALQRIREAAEGAKIQLSSMPEATITLPFLLPETCADRNFSVSLSRKEFEELAMRLILRCRAPVKTALKGAGLNEREISKVLLVGGTGRMPVIRAILGLEFPKREIIAPPNTEEIVARGAAVQAGILTGQIHNQLLVDVTPFALGIEVAGGEFLPVISQNSPIPTRASEFFTTAAHFQRGADIRIMQLNSALSDPLLIATFALDGFKGGARGQANIEVMFEIDESGLLTVTAMDMDTGRSNKISIRPESDRELKAAAEKAVAEVAQYNVQAELAELIKHAEYLAEQLIKIAAQAHGVGKVFKRCHELQLKLKDAAEKRSEKKLRGISKEAEKFLEQFE